MPWLQISIHTTQNHAEQAEDTLLQFGACSVTFTDAADQPILEPAPGETPIWQDIIATGLFNETENQQQLLSNIETALAGMESSISSETLEDQNWTRSWMDHYQAMQFGERLWVCPWHIDPPVPDAVNLRLDPGLAFGTGTHPTTSLCLRWLDQHIKQPRSLLDFGCGSGILAIAALLLGLEQADGVDIDPQALEASLANARANQVEDCLHLYDSEQFSAKHGQQQYEIVVANILSGPLVELAPTLAAHTLAGGDIVLSGILAEQANSIIDAYTPYFKMDAPLVEGDWVLIHGCRLA
ncbi:MAG: 50S ribosomal protein L11 methyltransferase [Gammaproteobacteria bacterium]|nr:50S ribosomal protein L11 methyltransferase [Gammaproteobacteria bacterium]MCW8923330.1 50S ribosomal protein L11 methyltransferase [Gammaproteobacteria bacterium]